jgi:hypothetical protein
MGIRVGRLALNERWSTIVWIAVVLALLLFFYFAAVLRYFD